MTSDAFDRRCGELYVRARISTHEIARRLKSSQGRVARALARENIDRRSFSESVKLACAKRKERANGSQS